MARIPRTLYHYCSLDTFNSIISNHTLWLSDISKSNDSTELKWLKTECRIALMKAQTSIYRQEIEKSIFPAGDVDAVFDYANEAAEKSGRINFVNSWAICFSEKKDSLGQWRGYADDGYGVSIGFKTEYLQRISELNQDTKFNPFELVKVKYSQKELDSFFQNTCGLKNVVDCKTDQDLRDLFTHCIAETIDNAAYYKNPSFREEKEWRIVFKWPMFAYSGIKLIDDSDDDMSKRAFEVTSFDYMVSNRKIVSHLEVNITDIRKAIAEIVAGPKCLMSMIDIRNYLIDKGVLKDYKDKSIKICRSNSTYR